LPATELVTGVMKAMPVKQVKLTIGTVMAAAVLGALGLAYQAGGSGSAHAAPPGKPVSEVEALRKENELLKLNLQIVLEKVSAQEAQLSAWKPLRVNINRVGPDVELSFEGVLTTDVLGLYTEDLLITTDVAHSVGEAEAALKALREAKDKEGQKKAAEALEAALKKLKEKVK
jgi:hypothetical protein